jgi:F0F1-type ATP synthase assembly protein I
VVVGVIAGDFVEERVGSGIWVFIGVDEALFVGLHVGVFEVGRNTASVASGG